MWISSHCWIRNALTGCALTIGLLAGGLAPGQAHAQWGYCYDDPMLWLSNGHKLDAGTSTQDAAGPLLVSISYTCLLYTSPSPRD